MRDLAQPSDMAPDVLEFFRVLADETRLLTLRLLTISDLKSGELGSALRLPSNAISYHLKQLRALGLLRVRRSSADARDVYYCVDLERLAQLYTQAGAALHPGLNASVSFNQQLAMAGSFTAPRYTMPLRVLFLCTHNSARSQMAEALLRQLGGDQVQAFSAGSAPTEVHPDALATLQELGVDMVSHTAKSMELFLGESFDYIITVCDRVRDVCPVFPGDPTQIHWSMPDPAVIEDPESRRKAFRETAMRLQMRVRYLLLLPHPHTGERFHSVH